MEKMRPFEASIPPYPIQNALTAGMRQTAAKQNRPEFMSLWAGQGVSMSRPYAGGSVGTDSSRRIDAGVQHDCLTAKSRRVVFSKIIAKLA
jgi:nitronate monooxygenase